MGYIESAKSVLPAESAALEAAAESFLAAVVANAAAIESGAQGGSGRHYLTFDGVPTVGGQMLRHLNGPTPGIANQFSVWMNLKLDDFSIGSQYLFYLSEASGSNNQISTQILSNGTEIRIGLRDSAGAETKRFNIPVSALQEGVGFTIGISFDGNASGDPMKVYLNGSDADSVVVKAIDGTGTRGDTTVSMSIMGRTNGFGSANGAMQDFALFSSVKTPQEFAQLHAQVDDAEPMFGFDPKVYITPKDPNDMGKNYGSGPASLNLMTDASNVSEANRVQGLLVTP